MNNTYLANLTLLYRDVFANFCPSKTDNRGGLFLLVGDLDNFFLNTKYTLTMPKIIDKITVKGVH